MTITDEEQRQLHADALEETGFWGKRGAGSIVYARSTGRYLVQLRSEDVLQPHTWGVWGGAVDAARGHTCEECVRNELSEETGYEGDLEIHFLVDFVDEDSGFRYSNYLTVVEEEFDPILNWEGEDFGWFEVGAFPDPLHFGLEYLLEKVPDPAAMLGLGTVNSLR